MLRPFFWCQEFDWDLKSQFGLGQLTPWSVSMIMFAWCLVMWTRWLPGVRRWRGRVWATLDPPEAGQRSDSGGERWGMMLNNPFIMQHPPGADNKRTQFGAWRAPQLLPLSPGWKSFFIWKTNIYFRNARSELGSLQKRCRDWKQRDNAATINLNREPGPGSGFMIVSSFKVYKHISGITECNSKSIHQNFIELK